MSTTDTIVYAYTKSEARKPPMEKQQMPPLFDEPTTLQNWHKHVNWVQSILLLGTPLIGLYGALTTELQTKTLIWAIIYYYITGLGITAGMWWKKSLLSFCWHGSDTFDAISSGYHRMWAHRAYRAKRLLRWIYCFAGSGAVEGSIYWWSRGHRAHHR